MGSELDQARISAEQDAKAAVNIVLWILLGLFLHFIGLIIAFVYKPSPTISNFIGKTQTFAVFYERVFKTKTRNLQLIYCSIGFLSGFLSLHYLPLVLFLI